MQPCDELSWPEWKNSKGLHWNFVATFSEESNYILLIFFWIAKTACLHSFITLKNLNVGPLIINLPMFKCATFWANQSTDDGPLVVVMWMYAASWFYWFWSNRRCNVVIICVVGTPASTEYLFRFLLPSGETSRWTIKWLRGISSRQASFAKQVGSLVL